MYTLEMFKQDVNDLLERTRKSYFAADTKRAYIFGQNVPSKYDVQKAFAMDLAFILNLAKLNMLDIDNIIPPVMQKNVIAAAEVVDNPLMTQVSEAMSDN